MGLTKTTFTTCLIGIVIVLCCLCRPALAQPLLLLEGELNQEIVADFEEGLVDSETSLELEFELGESLIFDGEFVNEDPGDDEVVNATNFELEVFPDFGENDLGIYLEGDFTAGEGEELDFGFEGEVNETDFDLGVEIAPGESIGYFDYYRRYESGISLRGQLETSHGFEFLSHRVSLSGAEIHLGEEVWELSGEIDFDLDTSFFDTRELEGEISLENETLRRFGLLSEAQGVFFYKIELLSREEDQSEVVEVVLHNSDRTEKNVGGWVIKGSGATYKISEGRVIPAEDDLAIQVDSGLIDETEPVSLVDPQGKTVDRWSFPRFPDFEAGLFQREAVIERNIDLSFENAEFGELVVEWAGEIRTEGGGLYYGDLKIDHTVEFREVSVGYEDEKRELEISLLDREVGLEYLLVETDHLEGELDIEVNAEDEFALGLEVEQEYEGIELENTLELDSGPDEFGVEMTHAFQLRQLEIEVGYEFENGELTECGIEGTLDF